MHSVMRLRPLDETSNGEGGFIVGSEGQGKTVFDVTVLLSRD
jgi:hypothetical protein